MEQRGDGMSIGYLGMLENIHKNADAFNTFSTSMRWKEFDRFSDQRISRWISMMIYIYCVLCGVVDKFWNCCENGNVKRNPTKPKNKHCIVVRTKGSELRTFLV